MKYRKPDAVENFNGYTPPEDERWECSLLVFFLHNTEKKYPILQSGRNREIWIWLQRSVGLLGTWNV
jgi:hypothetical protein